jgi:hypothetical protein
MLTPYPSASALGEFRVLSNPYEGDTAKLASSLASNICAEALQLFFEQFSAPLALESDQCLALSSFFGQENQFARCWTPAVPFCLLAVLNPQCLSPNFALLDLLVHGIQHGLQGNFKIELPRARKVNWGDLTLVLEGTVRFVSENGLTKLCNQAAVYPLCENRHERFLSTQDRKIRLLTQNDCPSWYNLDVPLVPYPDPLYTDQLRAALDLLSTYAPQYYLWVAQIITHIAIIDAPDRRLHSSSSLLHWGAIAVSACDEPLRACEMLIHEASHQYFHLLARLVAPVNEDPEFYSPLKNKPRPLSKLMLGYHAFANVYLFYRKCMEVTALRDSALALLHAVVRDLDAMVDLMKDRRYWNDFAQSLIAPLVERTTPLNLGA